MEITCRENIPPASYTWLSACSCGRSLIRLLKSAVSSSERTSSVAPDAEILLSCCGCGGFIGTSARIGTLVLALLSGLLALLLLVLEVSDGRSKSFFKGIIARGWGCMVLSVSDQGQAVRTQSFPTSNCSTLRDLFLLLTSA